MKTQQLSRELLILTIAFAPLIYLAVIWGQLPEQVPLHFDIEGKPDDWGSPWTLVWMIAGIQVFLYVLFALISRIDPRKQNMKLSAMQIDRLRLAIIIFMSIVFSLIIYKTLHPEVLVITLIPVLIFGLFAVIGNYMNNLKSNYFIGIRTPWTLENEDVWKKTHHFAAKLWFWGGLLGAIVCFFLHPKVQLWTLLSASVVLALLPIIQSYLIHKQLSSNTPAKQD